jgi:2-amino-4-hydroxy-6-hydroxymethyldihydropteridine diphosphokinase
MHFHTAYLSIGSNVGSRRKNLDAAIEILGISDEIDVISVSKFYRTQPQNYTDQDWFVNAALKIRTSLDPDALLLALKSVERVLDRNGKPFRFGPRIIDLDIIYYDELIFKNQCLEIPHPRMHERCFVLIPMCDIGADAVHPVFHLKPGDLLENIEKKETQEVILLDKED